MTVQIGVNGEQAIDTLPTHRDLTVTVTVQVFSRENEVNDAEKPGDEFPNNVLATEIVQTARTFITPLVLDLDGDGIELTSIENLSLIHI